MLATRHVNSLGGSKDCTYILVELVGAIGFFPLGFGDKKVGTLYDGLTYGADVGNEVLGT